MRFTGIEDQVNLGPVPPDIVASVVVSSAGAVVAQDYPTGAQIMQINSTGGTWLNAESTRVAIPAASSAGSTANAPSERVNSGDYRQIFGGSTGYSVTADAVAVITLSFWRK